MVIPSLCFGQSFKDLVKQYEKECSQEVIDTIKQYGAIEYGKHIPVNNESGKTLYYTLNPIDTVWESVDCPKFKYKSSSNYDLISSGSYWQSGQGSFLITDSEEVIVYSLQSTYQHQITRDYICKCKLREVEPFSEHFWNWLKIN